MSLKLRRLFFLLAALLMLGGFLVLGWLESLTWWIALPNLVVLTVGYYMLFLWKGAS